MEFEEHNFQNLSALAATADRLLGALGVPRREPNLLVFNGCFATSRAAIHAHPREWWVLLWELLTNGYKHPDTRALGENWRKVKEIRGGDHVVERYWHAFLDPDDTWLANRDEERRRCPPQPP